MGIPGLTTYVSNNAQIFYRDHALHDTLLLIDGNSLASQIYLELTITNSAFGGDYERYKHSVEKFLKMLLLCNILPIVVFDGGYETRKLKTTISRLKNTIIGVSSFKSVNQQNNVKLFPMFMKEVFKHVTRLLHIPCVQSDLEADFDLVYLSRKFHCPILSYDSDFYLNDVEYVPFFNIRLKGGRECQKSSTGKALQCQIYRVENLFKHFGGLSKRYIPLLQCMLGNDYISHMHFRYFLTQLDFRYSSGRKSPVSKRLAVLIKWCRGQRSLESALAKIIENLRFHQKCEAIKLLKRSIRDYRTEECTLYPYVMEQIKDYHLSEKLEELKRERSEKVDSSSDSEVSNGSDEDNDGIHDEVSTDLEENREECSKGDSCESTDNDSDTEVEESEEEKEEENEEKVESDQDEFKNSEQEESETAKHINKFNSNKQFNSDYLDIKWLVHAFRHGKVSTHVANIVNLASIYLLPLRENIKLDSVHAASYPLLSNVAQLLLSESSKCIGRQVILRVYTREMGRMKVVRLKCEDSVSHNQTESTMIINTQEKVRSTVKTTTVISSTKLHTQNDTQARASKGTQRRFQDKDISILEMANYGLVDRRRLLMKYLNLHNMDVSPFNGQVFPQEWNLFILSVIYWCNTSVHVNCYHVKCLVVSFIYLNIVQIRCGYFETMGQFNKKYAKKLNEFKTRLQNERTLRKKSKKSGKNRSSKGDEKNTNFMSLSNQKNKNAKDDVQKNSKHQNDSNGTDNHETVNKTSSIESTILTALLDKDHDQELSNSKTNLKTNVPKTIHETLTNTPTEKFIFLYEQFLQFAHLDERLRSNHTCFNKDVIHVLCEYQSLFYVISMVNSICNFPFEEVDMSRVYSGTFLYNLYTKIYNKDNNILLLFDHCDELFGVYNLIVDFIQENTVSNVFQTNVKKPKRKKKKKDKSAKENTEEEDVKEREVSEEDGGIEIDSDNIYSILQSVHI